MEINKKLNESDLTADYLAYTKRQDTHIVYSVFHQFIFWSGFAKQANKMFVLVVLDGYQRFLVPVSICGLEGDETFQKIFITYYIHVLLKIIQTR
jgi:hypothetical protein